MLLLGAASSIAARIQGAWIEAKETAALVRHWKKQATLLAVDATEAEAEAEILGSDCWSRRAWSAPTRAQRPGPS